MALKSSASSEALNYYQEGLRLYKAQRQKSVDKDKMAMFEFNIATAFYNKANWARTVEHIDEAFRLWNMRTNPNHIIIIITFLKNIFFLLIGLEKFFPKKQPNVRDNQIFDLSYKKSTSIFFIDSLRFFFFSLNAFNHACKFKIAQSTNAFKAYTGVGSLISLSGLPKKIAYKILESGKKAIQNKNIHRLISYKMFCAITDCFSGNFERCKTYDDVTVDKAIQKGALFEAVTYTAYLSYAQCEMGLFSIIESNIDRLKMIKNNYDFNLATGVIHLMRTNLLVKKRMLAKTLDATQEAMSSTDSQKEMGFIYQITFLSLKAEAHIYLNDFEIAENLISQAEQIVLQKKISAPYAMSNYFSVRLLFDVEAYETALNQSNRSVLSKFQKTAEISSKTTAKKFKNLAINRTKAYRLIGKYYWLIKKQKKALKW